MKPKKPFMIEGGPTGNEFLKIVDKGRVRCTWVDWDGTQFATETEAQDAIDSRNLKHPAKVIEILETARLR